MSGGMPGHYRTRNVYAETWPVASAGGLSEGKGSLSYLSLGTLVQWGACLRYYKQCEAVRD